MIFNPIPGTKVKVPMKLWIPMLRQKWADFKIKWKRDFCKRFGHRPGKFQPVKRLFWQRHIKDFPKEQAVCKRCGSGVNRY